MKDKVFIAWERNRELAESVAKKLAKNNEFEVVVGEELYNMSIDPNSEECTHYIILIDRLEFSGNESSDNKNNPPRNRRSNIMFEWAYFAGKNSEHLSVFLINEHGNFPKELMNCHTKKIPNAKGPKDDVIRTTSDEVVMEFNSRSINDVKKIDKFDIFNSWPELKRKLLTNAVPYSELELAHRLLHSIDPSYYYQDDLSACLSYIKPKSAELRFVCEIIEANAELFRETNGLEKTLDEAKITALKRKFDISNNLPSTKDENFRLWLDYFCEIRQALLCWLVARKLVLELPPDDRTLKRQVIKEAIESLGNAETALDNISKNYPEECPYLELYMGYLNYDKWLIKKEELIIEMDNEYKKDVNVAIVNAKNKFYDFYNYYRKHPRADKFLVKYFGAEYHTRLLNGIDIGYPSGSSPDKDKANKDRIKDPIIKDAILKFIQEIDYNEELRLLSELRKIHRESTPGIDDTSFPSMPKGTF